MTTRRKPAANGLKNNQVKRYDLHIDMAKLPAGIYLINITDEEGRRCVRKVVKE